MDLTEKALSWIAWGIFSIDLVFVNLGSILLKGHGHRVIGTHQPQRALKLVASSLPFGGSRSMRYRRQQCSVAHGGQSIRHLTSMTGRSYSQPLDPDEQSYSSAA